MTNFLFSNMNNLENKLVEGNLGSSLNELGNIQEEVLNEGMDMLPIIGIGALVLLLFILVAQYKLFKKANKSGWASFIPFYNTIVMNEIIGYNWYYLLIMLVLPFIPFVGSVLYFLFFITYYIKLAKCFGKSPLFGLGILFLPVVFFPIMAFNKNITYQGQVVKGNIDFKDLF